MKSNKETGKIEFTPTEMHEYNNKFAKDVQKHTVPSPETLKVFESMNSEITNIKVNMKGLNKDVGYIKKDVGKLHKKIDDFIECAEAKYANKWVEKLLIWGGSLIGGAIIVAFMTLILK